MLRKIRIILAGLFWTALVLLFLDFTGTLHAYFGWITKIQFIPALMALNLAAVGVLVLITLLFGRIYCSVLCPLGICQDIASGAANIIIKKNRFAYKKPRRIIRLLFLAVFVISIFTAGGIVSVMLEPYSIFGRMITQLLGPLYKLGNNVLAYFAERMGSYAFYSVNVRLTSIAALGVAILSFLVISVFAWKTGRGYCNTICPAGTVLGFISKFSLMKLRIDWSACGNCGLCAKNCKAGCIDTENKTIDYTRCVTCYKCIGKCPKGVIKYSMGKKQETGKTQDTVTDVSRRSFAAKSVLLTLGLIVKSKVYPSDFDGGLAPLEEKKAPNRSTKIIPPGAVNARIFNRRCTACHLCVSACPNQVLRPANDLLDFMRPHLSYERGYCRPECVKCSGVCPNGAIQPITTEEKSATQIGVAVWRPDLCVVLRDNVQCDRCATRCPTAAITMVNQNQDDGSLKIPMIDTGRCIGCGACEHLCPARPLSAIYVEGLDTHRLV